MFCKQTLRFFLVGMLFLALCGCFEENGDVYLIKHPEQFKAKLTSCYQAKSDQIVVSLECKSLIQLYRDILRYGEAFAREPQAFGLELLHDQMRLKTLETRQETQGKEYELLKRQVEIKIALIAQMTKR